MLRGPYTCKAQRSVSTCPPFENTQRSRVSPGGRTQTRSSLGRTSSARADVAMHSPNEHPSSAPGARARRAHAPPPLPRTAVLRARGRRYAQHKRAREQPRGQKAPRSAKPGHPNRAKKPNDATTGHASPFSRQVSRDSTMDLTPPMDEPQPVEPIGQTVAVDGGDL